MNKTTETLGFAMLMVLVFALLVCLVLAVSTLVLWALAVLGQTMGWSTLTTSTLQATVMLALSLLGAGTRKK
jgi:hypothetical protein